MGAELAALAKEQNPVVGYWDPMGLADVPLWNQDEEAVIGWLRHSEIKHGRIAMAGFVGYCFHANGIKFPFPGPQSVVTDGMSAPEVWDAIPFLAKLQIIGAIGIFEHISEDKNFLAADGKNHYMRGGKPGYMPTFSANVHPSPLNLWDPFGYTKKLTEEQKAKKLGARADLHPRVHWRFDGAFRPRWPVLLPVDHRQPLELNSPISHTVNCWKVGFPPCRRIIRSQGSTSERPRCW